MSILRRKTLLRTVIAAGLVLGLAYGGSVYFFWRASTQEERDAIAEADRLDPGWRLEELEKKQPIIPDEENGALAVLVAANLWPVQQSSSQQEFWAEGGIEQSIVDLSPEIQMNAKQQESLMKELGKALLALQEARKLIGLSRGRFPPSGSREDGSAGLACQESRRIATLLQLNSILQAQDNQADEALATAMAVLNTGRSIGDEPITISQLVRLSCESLAIRNAERVLAQGQSSEKTLNATQQLFQDEAAQTLLLFGTRGDRAVTFQRMTTLRTMFVPTSNLGGLFRLQTKCVEAAKAPAEEQLSRLQELKEEASKLDPLVARSFPSHEKIARSFLRNQAWLRCTCVALATERYRRSHGRWPNSFAFLVPEFLGEVPTDPYNGSPLKYRRLDDGVVIYSVGPDCQDNGGKLDRQNPTTEGTDIGFQLWDVVHRRQPWRQMVKEPKEDPEK